MTVFLLILMLVTSPLWVPVGLTLVGFAMMPVFWLIALVEEAIDLYKFDKNFKTVSASKDASKETT